MYLHADAKLGLAARFALVQAVEGGCSIRGAARRFKVSPATAHRWWHRWGARRPRRCRREDGLLSRLCCLSPVAVWA
jgi:transposase-like protein